MNDLNKKIVEKNLPEKYLLQKSESTTDPSVMIRKKLEERFKNTNVEASSWSGLWVFSAQKLSLSGLYVTRHLPEPAPFP